MGITNALGEATLHPGPFQRFDWRFFIAFAILGPLTFFVHELGHYLAGIAQGFDMWLTLNKVGFHEGQTPSHMNAVIVALAGPAVTLVIAIIASLWALRGGGPLAFGIVYWAFFMRLVASGISLVNEPQDEAAAGILLGIGPWPLTLVSVFALLGLLILTHRAVKASWKVYIVAYVLASIVVAGIVLSDNVIRGVFG